MNRQNRRIVIAALIIISSLLIYQAIGTKTSFDITNIPLPGPEGPDVYNYGVQFGSGPVSTESNQAQLPGGFNWGITQTHEMQITHSASNSITQPLPFGGSQPCQPATFTCPGGNPPSQLYQNGGGTLLVETTRPAVNFADTSGLGLTPGYEENLNYYSYQNSTNGNLTSNILNQYSLTIIPVDIVIQVSALSSSNTAAVYNWQNMNLWFALNTIVWQNTFPTQNNQPIIPNAPTPQTPSGTQSTYNYRGAVPIFAWIEGYQPWTFSGVDQTGKNVTGTQVPAVDNNGQLSQLLLPSGAYGFIQAQPSYGGRIWDLYSQPSQQYSLSPILASTFQSGAAQTVGQSATSGNPINAPQTVYFYINLQSFGPYANDQANLAPFGNCFFGGDWCAYQVWYPASYWHVRVLMGFYGQWTYLWTSQRNSNVNGPSPFTPNSSFQNRTSQVAVTSPPPFSFGGFNLSWPQIASLYAFFFIVIIALAGLALFWRYGLPKSGKAA